MAELRRSVFDPYRSSIELAQLKYEAAATVATHLGANHHLTAALSNLHVGPKSLVFSSVGDSDGSVIDQFVGLLNASATVLRSTDSPTRVQTNGPVCDPDLWAYIDDVVGIGSWEKVPADVATFVEDWFRKWGGNPTHPSGAKLHTRDLFSRVLSSLPLGNQASESQGWLQLAMGFAGAIGNDVRHNIKPEDPDAERIAWGVIGVGSLLITEMKRTHPNGMRESSGGP